jgi:hypothetical protein
MPKYSSTERLMPTFATPLKAVLVWLQERFPLTVQGCAVLIIALAALEIFGYGSMDLVVFALAVCALAIVAFSLLAVLLAGIILRYRLRSALENSSAATQSITVEAGYPNETGFSLPTLAWLPLISLDWQIVYPDYIESRKRLNADASAWEESLVPLRRCKTSSVTRRYTVSDVLGFCRFSWRINQQEAVVALPQTGHVRNLPLLRSLTAEDGISSPAGTPQGDRMDIRRYVAGDSVRNIMWKVYARNRHLNVRLAERSVHHSNRTLAYLLSGPDDEAAAAVARVAVESGALGEDWVFGADGSAETATTAQAALVLIAGSRSLGEPLAYGLDNFLQQMQSSQTDSHCIVFASASTGPWVQALRSSVGRFGGRFSIVLATDGLADEQAALWWQRLLFRRDAERRASHRTSLAAKTAVPRLSLLLAELNQFAESSLIVDRHTGLSFDQRLQRL